jgi:hypothetical protein
MGGARSEKPWLSRNVFELSPAQRRTAVHLALEPPAQLGSLTRDRTEVAVLSPASFNRCVHN